jgi:NAD(P)H dehydrogenase (quinone)
MGFDKCERAQHFAERTAPGRFDVQAEQRLASESGSQPLEVLAELARMDRPDVLVLQYTMWWHLPPAMLVARRFG